MENTQSTYCERGLELTKNTTFGDSSKENPDIVFTSVHDANSTEFLLQYPEIRDLIPADDRLLDDYLKIERDDFATDLAERVAKLIVSARPDLRVDVLEVPEVPRGIIDPNRISEKEIAVRNVLSVDHYSNGDSETPEEKTEKLLQLEEIKNLCMKLHRSIVDEVRRKISSATEFFIDFHTMRSRTGIDAAEKPHHLDQYLRSMTEPEFLYGFRRPVNIFSREPHKAPVSHAPLEAALEGKLNSADIRHKNHLPYPLLPYSMTYSYLNEKPGPGSGIAIDIPVHLLSKGNCLKDNFDHLDPKFSKRKAKRIAKLIAEACLEVLAPGTPLSDKEIEEVAEAIEQEV